MWVELWSKSEAVGTIQNIPDVFHVTGNILGEIDLIYALIAMADRSNTVGNWQDADLFTENKLFVCFFFLVLLVVTPQ
jgi:hypothetical protein